MGPFEVEVERSLNEATYMKSLKKLAKPGTANLAPIDPIASGSSQLNIGPDERFLSVFGGSLLATVGLRRGGLGGVLLAALGGTLIYSGISGYSILNRAIGRDTSDGESETDVLEISEHIAIYKPKDEVYAFWRKLENLPRFMQHLASVTQLDTKRSHWIAKLDSANPLTKIVPTLEWDAEIIDEEENNYLIWRSVPGASVDNSGEVRFFNAPQGGTEVYVTIKYRAPEGVVGETLMNLFNPAFKKLVQEDIQRFKRLLETDELPVG